MFRSAGSVLRFQGKKKRVAVEARRNVRQTDPFLRFGLRQGLHISLPVKMGGIHDLDGARAVELKDILQGEQNEIHRGDIIVMDDHAVERSLGGFLLQVFANFGQRPFFHGG